MTACTTIPPSTIVPLPTPAGVPTYSINWSWSPSGDIPAKYYVYVSTDDSTFNLNQIVTTTSCTISGLLYYTNYWLEVSAIDTDGTLMGTSTPVEFQDPIATPTPSPSPSPTPTATPKAGGTDA